MAILGLLIREPDTTRRIGTRLVREYPHGRWSRSIAHNNIKNLAKNGLIRKIRDGRTASEHLYEVTPEGIAAFRAVLSETAKKRSPVRDAMQLWLEHSDESERPEIIQVIKEIEKTARAEYEAAKVRLNTEEKFGNFGPLDGSDWNGLIRAAVLKELMLRAGHEALRLMRLREALQSRGQGLHVQTEENGDG